jgi:hypothetical protein
MHDDLLTLEGWIEVRDDANLPAGRIRLAPRRADRVRLGRSAVLAALAERALVELRLGRRLEPTELRAGTASARRREDDGSS